jgi:hypothetical protein
VEIEKQIKVPNGKLLIIKAEIEDNKLVNVKIQGDFFFYPEDKLNLFEDAVLMTSIENLKEVLDDIVQNNNLKLVGLTTDAVCQLVKEIFEEANIK